MPGLIGADSLRLVRGYELWRDEVNAAGGIKVGGKSYKVNFGIRREHAVYPQKRTLWIRPAALRRSGG